MIRREQALELRHPPGPVTGRWIAQLIASNRERSRQAGALALQMMDKAVYGAHPGAHFGLAARCCAHTTSPIRRSADLRCQQAAHAAHGAGDAIEDDTEGVARHLGRCEERATKAQREAAKRWNAFAIAAQPKESARWLDATIVAVREFGLFCERANGIVNEGPDMRRPNFSSAYMSCVSLESAVVVVARPGRIEIAQELTGKPMEQWQAADVASGLATTFAHVSYNGIGVNFKGRVDADGTLEALRRFSDESARRLRWNGIGAALRMGASYEVEERIISIAMWRTPPREESREEEPDAIEITSNTHRNAAQDARRSGHEWGVERLKGWHCDMEEIDTIVRGWGTNRSAETKSAAAAQ